MWKNYVLQLIVLWAVYDAIIIWGTCPTIYEYKRLALYKIQLLLTNSWLTRRWGPRAPNHQCNDNCQVKITKKKIDCVLYHGDNWSNIKQIMYREKMEWMKTLVFRFFRSNRSNVLHIFVKYIQLRNQEFYIQLLCDLLQNEGKKNHKLYISCQVGRGRVPFGWNSWVENSSKSKLISTKVWNWCQAISDLIDLRAWMFSSESFGMNHSGQRIYNISFKLLTSSYRTNKITNIII